MNLAQAVAILTYELFQEAAVLLLTLKALIFSNQNNFTLTDATSQFIDSDKDTFKDHVDAFPLDPFRWQVESKIIGDVDDNGIVDLAYAILALQVVTEETEGHYINRSADVNNDEIIGMAEAVFVMQQISQIQ